MFVSNDWVMQNTELAAAPAYLILTRNHGFKQEWDDPLDLTMLLYSKSHRIMLELFYRQCEIMFLYFSAMVMH